MIELGQHLEYIAGAYFITLGLVGILVWFTYRDYHQQAKKLADLEAKGIRRRSEKPSK